MYIDFSYLIVAIIIAAVGGIASYNVRSTYQKFNKVQNSRGLTGADVARAILDRNGLQNVSIERISGELSDHFDPTANVVRLSSAVYSGSSVAAAGIAAHECGHAIQHAQGYMPNKIRSALVPVSNFCSSIAWVLITIGLFLPYQYTWVCYLGIILYSTSALFCLVTLPVEFNASSRAVDIIGSELFFGGSDVEGVKKVLTSAALTYVAALFSSVLQLLRIIYIVNGRNRRN